MLLNRGTKDIKTNRLLLRKFREDDTKSFYELVGSDANVTKYVVWNVHKDIDDTINIINKWISNYENDYTYYWAIELEKNQVIGSISCVNVDIKNETCELGYAISSNYWNKGYTTEALKAVIAYLQEEGFKTIYAKHLSLNPASGKVMLKCGMKYEGTLRNRMIDKNTGKYDDLLSYSITIDE